MLATTVSRPACGAHALPLEARGLTSFCIMKNKRSLLVLCWLFLCTIAVLLADTAPLFAQAGGILIDPNGVVARHAVQDFGNLTARQLNAARTGYALSADVSAASPMRCVSLNRLEKAMESGETITEEMKYLAGIQRITHVFYFPGSKDIVIAGPAEGWFPGYEGAMIGRESLLPVCELQHLVTALRAYAPGKEGPLVTCSIDPTPEGIVGLQQFLTQNRILIPQRFADGVRQSVGMQTVTIEGIPETTHAAQMMVAADYRMKRIGLGLDPLRVQGLQTFIANTEPNVSNALFRWYFMPDYESVLLTADRTGMQLVGDGVKLVAENELVSELGERAAAAGPLDRGSAAFTQSFTQHYPHIATQALVFAQLRNWIDMLICAAHIQREDFYGQSGWSMEFFGSEEKYPLETFVAAKEVEPVVNIRTFSVRGGRITVAPVGGGIEIDAEVALSDEHAQPDKDGKIARQQEQISLHLPEGVWWWDVR